MAGTDQQGVPPAIVAEQAVATIRALPAVLAICLVGSVARGDERPDSDVDLLIIGPLQATQIRREFPDALRCAAVSLICKTPGQLGQLASQGSLFLEHVRTEGQVVHDPLRILADAFAIASTVPLDTDGEVRRRLASLKHYRDLDRFGGTFSSRWRTSTGSPKDSRLRDVRSLEMQLSSSVMPLNA
jgi:hypothetical protein